jgi:predicted DNA-binding transcriptional regulator YafY
MNLSRISRLVQLLGLLQAGKSHNAAALAQLCKVSRRTIFRDLEVLRQAGVPLLFDDDQCHYRIPATYYLPPTNFSAEEALAVMILCYEFGADHRMPFHEAAQSAALKFESSLPAAIRERLRGAIDAVWVNPQPGAVTDGRAPFYQQLLACIGACRSVRILYGSFSDAEPVRLRLSPYRLLFSRRSWYVIGRSSLHREVRTFNVGRIQELELLDEPFHVPRGFSIERYLRNAWHLIPDGPDQEVVVRFAPMVARNVAEVAWHKTQRIVQRDDGTIDFHVRVSGVQEISWWILGYVDQAEVLKPARLRQLVAERAGRMSELYNGRA